jgi:hypothetical protein
MKDLVKRILELRTEVQQELDKRRDVLTELEKLTVNQLDLFQE